MNTVRLIEQYKNDRDNTNVIRLVSTLTYAIRHDFIENGVNVPRHIDYQYALNLWNDNFTGSAKYVLSEIFFLSHHIIRMLMHAYVDVEHNTELRENMYVI